MLGFTLLGVVAMKYFNEMLGACAALYVHPQSADWSAVVLAVNELAEKLIEEDQLIEKLVDARGEYKYLLQDRIYDNRMAQVGIAGGSGDICAALGHNTIPFPKGR
jgi:hypothetical protein